MITTATGVLMYLASLLIRLREWQHSYACKERHFRAVVSMTIFGNSAAESRSAYDGRISQ